MTRLYKSKLQHKYQWMQLDRTGARGDGLVTLLKHGLGVRDQRNIIFRDLGDRVAMLLRIDIPSDMRYNESPNVADLDPHVHPHPATELQQSCNSDLDPHVHPHPSTATPETDQRHACREVETDPRQACREVVLVNTHLLFPHQPYFSIIRLRELRKILAFLELYHQQLPAHLPIVMCGDFNGAPNDPTCALLRDRNFSTSAGETTTWVTHKTHDDDIVCCDYIFVQNANQRKGPLETHWLDFVFRSTKQRRVAARAILRSLPPAKAGVFTEADLRALPVQVGDDLAVSENVSEYRCALENLGFARAVKDLSDSQLTKLMTGPDSLYVEKDQLMDEKEAFQVYDIDGSGGIDAEELSRISESLGTVISPDRLAHALSKLGWLALRDVKGQVDSNTFEQWWRDYMQPFFQPQSTASGKEMEPFENRRYEELEMEPFESRRYEDQEESSTGVNAGGNTGARTDADTREPVLAYASESFVNTDEAMTTTEREVKEIDRGRDIQAREREEKERDRDRDTQTFASTDEAMMTIKDGVRRRIRVQQLFKDLRPSLQLTMLRADIYPPSLKLGVWPSDFMLSDHGIVTCTFRLKESKPYLAATVSRDSEKPQGA